MKWYTRTFLDSLIKEKMEECFRGEVVPYEMKYKYPTLGRRELSRPISH